MGQTATTVPLPFFPGFIGMLCVLAQPPSWGKGLLTAAFRIPLINTAFVYIETKYGGPYREGVWNFANLGVGVFKGIRHELFG